jgi:hypothetical protein
MQAPANRVHEPLSLQQACMEAWSDGSWSDLDPASCCVNSARFSGAPAFPRPLMVRVPASPLFHLQRAWRSTNHARPGLGNELNTASIGLVAAPPSSTLRVTKGLRAVVTASRCLSHPEPVAVLGAGSKLLPGEVAVRALEYKPAAPVLASTSSPLKALSFCLPSAIKTSVQCHYLSFPPSLVVPQAHPDETNRHLHLQPCTIPSLSSAWPRKSPKPSKSLVFACSNAATEPSMPSQKLLQRHLVRPFQPAAGPRPSSPRLAIPIRSQSRLHPLTVHLLQRVPQFTALLHQCLRQCQCHRRLYTPRHRQCHPW